MALSYKMVNTEEEPIIYQIFSKPNIKSFIRGKWLEWAGHDRRSTGIVK